MRLPRNVIRVVEVSRVLRPVAGIVVGVLCLLFPSGVGGARLPAQPLVDAVYARIQSSDTMGIVLVDRIRSDQARLTTALGHLMPGHRYRLTFSRAGCTATDSQAMRIARVWVDANADGAAFRTLIVGTEGGLWREARSMRLMEEEGIFYFCRAAHPVDDAAAADADGAHAAYRAGSHRGLTIDAGAGNDTVTVTTALIGLMPGVRYRIVHSPLTCKQFLQGDPDQPIVIGRFRADPDGMAFAVRTESVGANESITIGSHRTETVGGHVLWGCTNLHPFKSAT